MRATQAFCQKRSAWEKQPNHGRLASFNPSASRCEILTVRISLVTQHKHRVADRNLVQHPHKLSPPTPSTNSTQFPNTGNPPCALEAKRDAATRLEKRRLEPQPAVVAKRECAYPPPHAGALRLPTALLTALSPAGLFSYSRLRPVRTTHGFGLRPQRIPASLSGHPDMAVPSLSQSHGA